MNCHLGFDRLNGRSNLLIQRQRAVARNNLRLRIWRIKDLYLGQLLTLGNLSLYGHSDLPAAMSKHMLDALPMCH